jgi:eukaryotic-like serine/threonine-protein kinase
MESKDWQSVEEFYNAASELPPGERAAYLTAACVGRDAVRKEVESLLAAIEKRPDFLERPVFSRGMTVLSKAAAEESLVGRTIGPYRVLRSLGRGGMGSIYLAEHEKLERKVALKFLSRKLIDDVWAKRQFVKEAQAVAKLDHPNICAIYGFEEVEGHSFIVMQYVEGETLAAAAGHRPVELERLLDLAAQIGEALSEAHAYGIIHRDIKPQNIMLTPGGQVKVLDFGLAKTVRPGLDADAAGDSHFSRHDRMIGTVAYMSPEQLCSERIDFRSDIFALGVVLYELAAGHNPFSRDSEAETISAILTSESPPLSGSATDGTERLGRLIEKCLRKDREQRYQSASEFLLELNRLRQERNEPVSPRHGHLWWAGSTAAFLSILVAAVYLTRQVAVTPRTLVIFPFVNESTEAGTEYLDEAITGGLAKRLARLPDLRVRTPSIVRRNADAGADPREMGRALEADVVLTGSISQRGEVPLLNIRLTKVADGSRMWEREYDLESAVKVQAVNGDISGEVASELLSSLTDDEKRLLRSPQTENAEAFRLYSLGRHYWGKRGVDNLQQAIEFFTQAINADPNFALAYAGLADTYVLMDSPAYGSLPSKVAMPAARIAARKALELDGTLSEAHTTIGVINLKNDWNWREAEGAFRQAISLNPDYAQAHYWYSNLLALTGRPGEAIIEARRALELEPDSPQASMNLGRAYCDARQYDTAIGHLLKLVEREPENIGATYVLGLVYQKKGMSKQALEAFEKVYRKDPLPTTSAFGYALALAGRKAEAYGLLNELDEMSKRSNVSPKEKAIIYVGLGDNEHALPLLIQSCEERLASLPFVAIDPFFDSIREDPRYPDLVRCGNFPP